MGLGVPELVAIGYQQQRAMASTKTPGVNNTPSKLSAS